jgi:hypothetical protein
MTPISWPVQFSRQLHSPLNAFERYTYRLTAEGRMLYRRRQAS